MGKDMDQIKVSSRTDEQLEAILRETGDWIVRGREGQILCMAASLRRAIERAADFAASDAIVTGISRLPVGDIIVLPDQIMRLRNRAVEAEAV
jgi:hypothetical protein